jgi:nicotinate-nucleotide pyrophosphorylase (carboxylating)
MQRLSGIATRTRTFVDRLHGTGTRLLDTRKTTPGLRLLEKAAVLAGGGENHRLGLHDMVLIKDNHVRAAGGLKKAVERARALAAPALLLEVEAQSFAEVEEACAAGVDRILLDNMAPVDVERALDRIDATATAVAAAAGAHPRRRPGARRWPEVEVSGGLTLDTVRDVAELGVDYVSVGGLTHSAPALDLSLEIVSLA